MPNHKKPRSLCVCGCGNFTSRPAGKFFSNKCQGNVVALEIVRKWKSGEFSGVGAFGVTSRSIKRYLISVRGNQCERCEWKEVNPITKKVPLEMDHKDGDHKNASEENLVLLCPNCHSLTPTFRSLNKGRGRANRRVH